MERGTGLCNHFINIDNRRAKFVVYPFPLSFSVYLVILWMLQTSLQVLLTYHEKSLEDNILASFNFTEFIVALHGREKMTIDIYTLSVFSLAVGILTCFPPLFSFDLPGNILLPSVFWCFQEDQKRLVERGGLNWRRLDIIDHSDSRASDISLGVLVFAENIVLTVLLAVAYSKLTIEELEQVVKYVHS